MSVSRVFWAALLTAFAATAQEPLNTILDRGYVSHWLVCGPFTPDGEGGIAGALQRDAGPLTDTDFMRPVGGVAAVRPQHLMKVTTPTGSAIWQQAGANNETLDLAPFFPGANEGIAYAAFYARAVTAVTAYVDLETPLGARVWVNGVPTRDIHSAPVIATGVDRFLVSFRGGLNLVVIEIPGASIPHLAEMAHITEPDFKTRGFQNRPLLHGLSGYEFGMRIHPVQMLGSTAFVPRLRSAGTFSGEGAQASEDVLLTFFNPSRAASPNIAVTARVPGGGKPITRAVSPILPETESEITLSIPLAGVTAGQPLNVEVTLEAGGEKAVFTSPVVAQAAPQGGTVYVVTGAHFAAEPGEDQSAFAQRRNAELARQVTLLDKEKDYGFDLGTVEEWMPFWDSRPDQRAAMVQAVAHGRCASNAGFGAPDERIVSGETLARNLIYGFLASRTLLGDRGGCYYAWHAPGLCAQTPQLLTKASVVGIVSDLRLPGIPELSWRLAPTGDRVLHRHKQDGPGFRSVAELRDAVGIQRRELLERGLSTDVLVNESALEPPEPFFLGACEALAHSSPSIKMSGSGGREFLNTTLETLKRGTVDLPISGRSLMTYQPGDLLSQTHLKQTFASAENRLVTAEKFSTMAAMMGASYPESTLDAAWRQLLYSSAPNRLGFSETSRIFVDTLAASRDALTLADGVRDRAMRYIASQVDTYGAAPSRAAGGFAILVFNPSSWPRTDICAAEVNVKSLTGLTLVDDAGKPVSYWAESVRPGVARLNFIANDVPAVGYRTYFASPGKTFPVAAKSAGAQIENEFFTLLADARQGGAIVSLKDKKSGAELAHGLVNDVVAISEDTAKNHGGRDLWTAGEVKRASQQPASISITKSAIMQRLDISVPFQGGVLIREITLYSGVPRIDCQVRFDGVARKGAVYAVALEKRPAGSAPVMGDRYGATVGRRGRQEFDYRTDEGKNPSGSGLQPALGWFAASPNDHLRIGLDIAIPLAPTAVIFAGDPAMERAARDLQIALVGRGIPCSTSADTPRKLNTVWTDSTEMPNLSDDLDHGAAMRIVLGNPTQNLLCKNLCRQLDGDTLKRFMDRMRQGAMLFFNDKDVPKGYPPVPTLILAGETTTQTTALAATLQEAISAGGAVQIPAEASAITDGKPQPANGLAVLFEGSTLAGLEPDGTMTLGLAHGSTWSEKPDDLSNALVSESNVYRYALYPFDATWRQAGVPRAAHAFAEPLYALAAPLHLAQVSARASLLSAQDPNFIVTAVKPASYQAVTRGGQDPTPSNGIAVRGFESIGQRWEGGLTFQGGLRSASKTDLLDRTLDTLGYSDKAAVFTCGGFSIETLTVLPSVFGTRGPKSSLDAPPEDRPTLFTRYWRHNQGAAPAGLQKISVVLSGNLSGKDPVAELVVANNQTDTPIRGSVTLNASAGWSIAPAQLEYDLKSGEVIRQQIAVLRDAGASSSGGVIARTEYEGRSYWDILEQGEQPLTIDVNRNRNEVKAVVKNSGSLPAMGYLDLIAPDEFEGERGGGIPVDLVPRRAPISVAPFQEQSVVFQIVSPAPPAWMVLRLAANGDVLYRPVEVRRGQ